MAVLGRIVLASAALLGCYSPERRDCTVTCASANDCGTEQVCGSDGFCAAPGIAGSCLAGPIPGDTVDAAMMPIDGAPGDAAPPPPPSDAAAPPPDAPPTATVVLELRIGGDGAIEVDGVGTCDADSDHHCMFMAPEGVIHLEARPDPGWRFDKWETDNCKHQDATCIALALPPKTTVRVKFKPNYHDD